MTMMYNIPWSGDSGRLSHAQHFDLQRSRQGGGGANRSGSLRLLLRCYPLAQQELGKAKGTPHPYPFHCWPLETTIRVNQHQILNVKQVGWFHTTLLIWVPRLSR
jgi:hypothetical protein